MSFYRLIKLIVKVGETNALLACFERNSEARQCGLRFNLCAPAAVVQLCAIKVVHYHW